MPYPIAVSAWLDRRLDALLPARPPADGRAAARRTQLVAPAPAMSSPSARPGHPPPPAGMAGMVGVRPPPRKPGERLVQARDAAPREHQDSGMPPADDDVALACCGGAGEREHGRQRDEPDGGSDGDGMPVADAAGAAAADEELDSQVLAALLAQSHDSGMFEVLLPGGGTLGVAVDVTPAAVDYLLTPSPERLAAQLRGRQMELAGQLGQRIGRSVRLTVL